MRQSLTRRIRHVPRYWLASVLIHGLLVFSLGFVAFTVAPVTDEGALIWTAADLPQPNCFDPEKVLAETDPAPELNTPPSLPKELLERVELANQRGPEEPNDQSSSGAEQFADLGEMDANDLIASGAGWYSGAGMNTDPSGGNTGLDTEDDDKAGTPGALALKAERKCIDAALNWLAYHQEADGHWEKQPGATPDTAVETTALALLALIENRQGERIGMYCDNVKRAVAWLIERSKLHRFCESTDPGNRFELYSLLTLALHETVRSGGSRDTCAHTRDALLTCIQYLDTLPKHLRSHQHFKSNRWYVLALKSALCCCKEREYAPDPILVDAVLVALPDIASEQRLENDSFVERHPHFCWQLTYGCCMTPWRLFQTSTFSYLSQVYCPETRQESMAKARDFVKCNELPKWNPSTNLYTWLDGSLLALNARGEIYRIWREHLVASLVSHQCTAGDDCGSWSPTEPHARRLGRTGQTALACLCMSACLGRRR